jgi:subtilisin family serine protease
MPSAASSAALSRSLTHSRTHSLAHSLTHSLTPQARDADGHGTHCAGSIAGSSTEPTVGPGNINDFEGMAPEARLAVIDVADETGAFYFPPGNDTFPMDWARMLGAKVHSCSWGSYSLFQVRALSLGNANASTPAVTPVPLEAAQVRHF